MEYKINKHEDWRTEVNVSIEAGSIQSELDERFKDYKSNVKLEGFRKGKVPNSLLEKMFGEKIESDVFQPYISDAYKKIFDENEFDPMNPPELRDIHFDEIDGLTFTIYFEVRPEVEVKDYEDMPVEQVVFQVEDDDVDGTLEDIRQRNAMIYTVEGEAQTGHILVADLQELDHTGVPMVGKKMDNESVYLGEEEENQITPQLVGIKVGEERKIVIKHQSGDDESTQSHEPDHDHFYMVTVNEIKERKVPELDDEFAKDLGDFDTMVALKEDIKNRLEQQAESESKISFRRALGDELIKRNDFQIPPSMLENYLNAIVEDVKGQNKGKVNEDQLREYYKTIAIRNIKWHIIREALISQEKLKVTEEEVESRIKALEDSGEATAEQAQNIRKTVGQKKQLEDTIMEEKVYEFLTSKAKIDKVEKRLRQTQPQ